MHSAPEGNEIIVGADLGEPSSCWYAEPIHDVVKPGPAIRLTILPPSSAPSSKIWGHVRLLSGLRYRGWSVAMA